MARLFEERERAAELLFARSEEMRFLAHCHGIRSLAAYATTKLGFDAAAAEAYADVLITALLQGIRDEPLIERVRADLAANGQIVGVAELRAELARSSAQALHGLPPLLTVNGARPEMRIV